MPLSISSNAVLVKNQMNDSGAWIICGLIEYDGETPVRVCSNNEQITWDSQTWDPYPFELGDIEESKDGDMPKTSLTITDLSRILIPIIEEYDGGVGASFTVYVVHSDYLSNATPELEQAFEIVETTIHSGFQVKFSLGVENLMTYRVPQNRFLKNHCRYKEFGGSLCGYTGSETECSRSFERCKELGNQARFGGCPGVGQLGMQV